MQPSAAQHTSARALFKYRRLRHKAAALRLLRHQRLFEASPQPYHVLWLLLVQRLQNRDRQAPANASGRCLRQLRRDGETSARCRLRAACRRVTRHHADCLVVRERCGGGHHVLPVAAHGGGGPGARVAAVRMVHRAHDVRQLLWGCGVGGVYDEPREFLKSKCESNLGSRSVVCSPCLQLVLSLPRDVRDRVHVPERGQAHGA